jgi:large subunit ribosomal protein L10
MVADYVDKMSRSRALILTDYRGLSVAQVTELRRNLREVDGEFQVVKNSLFQRALEESGMVIPVDHMVGPLAVGYCLGDAPPVAKALADYAKDTEILAIKGAVIGGNILDPEGVKALASLPPREVVLGQLLASVQGPMSSLVSTITAPLRELVQVLQARADQATAEQGQEAAA